MNLLHMTYFIAVVEHESISGAAQSLFITQQTLSSHVAAMEKELGTSLFDRRPKFRLTQAGSSLLLRSLAIIGAIAEFIKILYLHFETTKI